MKNQLTPASKWILKNYLDLEQNLQQNLEKYELSHNVEAFYSFLWDEYADWYVEYLKTDDSQLAFAKEIFWHFINKFSPYFPFQAEALYKDFFKQDDILAMSLKPNLNYNHEDVEGYLEFEEVIIFVKKLRSIRGLFGVDLGLFLEIFTDYSQILKYQDFIKLTARASICDIKRENLYSFKVAENEFAIDILKYIGENKETELKRTEKILKNLEKQIKSLESQLNNPNFLSKAGTEVVSQKEQDLKQRNTEKQEQLEKISFLKS
jgi:valyl-tRNA synthetase